MEADLRREYGLRPPDLAALSAREFLVYVGGLTAEARFRELYQAAPVRADTPEAIGSIFGSYLG